MNSRTYRRGEISLQRRRRGGDIFTGISLKCTHHTFTKLVRGYSESQKTVGKWKTTLNHVYKCFSVVSKQIVLLVAVL